MRTLPSLSEVPLNRPERERLESLVDEITVPGVRGTARGTETVESAPPDAEVLDTSLLESGFRNTTAAGSGSPLRAIRKGRRNPAEVSLAWLANAVWAVAGLLLWLPLLARAFVVTVGALVHGALTGQKALGVPQRIRRASRFYTDPFLRRRQFEHNSSAVRIRWRPWRLLFEVLWALGFYGTVLWAGGMFTLSPAEVARQAVGVVATWQGELLANAADLWARAPHELVALASLDLSVWIALGFLLLLAHLTGWWLAMRRD